jgi:thiol-disulfide isomerase/thioredoxin
VSPTRVRAPELAGRGGWIGTGGAALSLTELRGRFVLLDFWTLCCANCLHVIEELRPLEERFTDVLVVIGVHSPKFVHEAGHGAVVAAVERYDVHHPVLDDPDLSTWRQYAVRAWPTLVLIDPEGYVVAHVSGEGHVAGLARLLDELVAEHDARGTLRRGHGVYEPPAAPTTTLRYPGGVAAAPDVGVVVADAGHHQLALLDADLQNVRLRVGSGTRGFRDGDAGQAQFAEPEGLCVLPREIASAVGYDVLVADTGNHALRGVSLPEGAVQTVAGDGAQWMQGDGTARLSTPWDVVWWPAMDRVVVAMAGIHQLWSFDPRDGSLEVLAGTTNEGRVDGPAEAAWLAQPSRLAADGDRLWFVDSETSSLRWLVLDPDEGLVVDTAIGEGLFDFGHVDGPADQARLQHPLGLTVLPDGSVAVADTYNGAVRRFDPTTGVVSTVATGLEEPTDVLVDGEHLLVVEATGHRVVRVVLPEEALLLDGGQQRTQRPVTELSPGVVELRVPFEPPPGQQLDERWGPATRLTVSASPPELLLEGDGVDTGLERRIRLDGSVGQGLLHVAAVAASCDKIGEHPTCHVHQQDWGVPVTLVAGGPTELELPLRGVSR